MIFSSKLQIIRFITLILLASNVQAANQKPIANAGVDQNVMFSTNVILSAEKSLDADGEIKTYQWTQIKGTKVILQNSKTVSATFKSPQKSEELIFKVTITDDKKASATDTVIINVSAQIVQSQLNDTGITFCSNGAFNVDSCKIGNYPRQDAEFGRDFLNNDDKDGHAGFSFSKISATGESLSLDAPVWACVKDNVTGLVWEVKTSKNSIENYNFQEAQKFVKTINTKKLCGVNTWRLPEIQELQSIVDYSVALPNTNIDLNFFPNSTNQIYWSTTPYAKNTTDIWSVYFNDGRVYEQNKKINAAVRLVSSAQKSTAQNYVISKDGTEVFDSKTGLTWRRCVEGMKWNGTTCVGEPFGGMFQESLERADSQARLTGKAWRLPNVKELASLVDATQPDIAIDLITFPATPNDQFWSSSTYAADAFFGWMTHFYYGASYYSYLEDTGMMRLVHD